MSLLERKIFQGESFSPENSKTILHLAITDGYEGDEIELTYNNGFTTKLYIPATKTIEINSPLITISRITAKAISGDYITALIELDDKMAISNDLSEENYKIQYIKGDPGKPLTWEDLTDSQRQSLSFRLMGTYFKEDLFDDKNISSEAITSVSVAEKLHKLINEKALKASGFYLFQNNDEDIFQSWLFQVIIAEPLDDSQVVYVGEFAGAKGDKGDVGPQGPPPELATSINRNIQPFFDANGNINSFNAKFSSYDINEFLKGYKLSMDFPEFIYFGSPNDNEAKRYPFNISITEPTFTDEPIGSKKEYYIISGGTANSLKGGVTK